MHRAFVWIAITVLVMATTTAGSKTLVNVTPHDIVVHLDDKETVTFPRSGSVVRLEELPCGGDLPGLGLPSSDIKIRVVPPPVYGGVKGLPDGKKSHLIVSSIAGEAMAKLGGFTDIYSPDMSSDGAVRDAGGRIVGTKGLIKWC